MRARWLRQTGARDLILICTGWAVGAMPFQALAQTAAHRAPRAQADQPDLLLFSDYRDLTLPRIAREGYRHVSLVAYSFGVAAACQIGAAWGPLARKVALSGTATPSDAATGIPPDRLRQTEAQLSMTSLAAFARRAGSAVEMPADLDRLRAELRAVAARPAGRPLSFDRIWLGTRDRVFPPDNLARAWSDQAAQVRWRDGGHNLLSGFHHWDEVLA